MGWFDREIVDTETRTKTRDELESRDPATLDRAERNRLDRIRDHERWIGDQMLRGRLS